MNTAAQYCFLSMAVKISCLNWDERDLPFRRREGQETSGGITNDSFWGVVFGKEDLMVHGVGGSG
jgi:hypothetical protein